ncbi:MAG: YqgE/AlgH family protein [Gammaproteobacteria bacterium]|nr:MAG: YqgE/AlgH family protein [Gammaproteobacteria bacterium]
MENTQEVYSLKNQFLIAMPHLESADFTKSVTYLCEHNDNGAMGIVINHPSDTNLGDIFNQLGIACTNNRLRQHIVLAGGPVQTERGFVLHQEQGQWNSSVQIGTDLYLTTSQDILESIALGQGPESFMITLGYAGWSSHQLEDEISQNFWLTCSSDQDILFNIDIENRWQATANILGIDLNLVATEAGHA